MFSKIAEIKSIREQKRILSEREAELSKPLLVDLSLIPMIYEWFCEIQEGRDCPPRKGSVHQRKKFLFIVLFLYSPGTLAGERMPNGLRKEISKVLDFCKSCTISNNRKDVSFWFDTYGGFSRDIEYLYTEILNRLKFKGLIK